MKQFFRPIALCLIFALVSLTGCDYVANTNEYGLAKEDFDLLAGSDTSLTPDDNLNNYQFDFTGSIESGDAEPIQLEGDGGILMYEETPIPDIMLNVDHLEIEGNGRSGDFAIEFRLINLQVYYRGTNNQTGEQTDWGTTTFVDLMNAAIGSSSTPLLTPEGDLFDPEAFSGLFDGMEISDDMGLGKYTEIDRREDEEIDGVPVAKFEIEVDYRDWLASPEFSSMLGGITAVTGSAEDTFGLPPEMLGMFMPMLVQMFVQDFTIEVNQYVSLDNRYQKRSETEITMQMDFSLLSMATSILPQTGQNGDAAPTLPALAPIDLTINFDTDYRDFGETFEIEVPADAQPMSLEEFGQALSDLVN